MIEDTRYSDEVLRILTNGIGAELGKPIRLSYYQLKEKLLTRINKSENLTIDEENIQIILDVIALSVFHQNIITPFYGSNNFIERLENFNVKSISIGTYSLVADDKRKISTCTKAFYAILKKVGLSPTNLAISTIDNFVEGIKNRHITEDESENE